MIFDRPQWRWGADSPGEYGNVSNRVSITRNDKEVGEVHVSVPSEVFLLLPLLFGEDWKEIKVSFYLDRLPDGSWIFGICSDAQYSDLWRYTAGSLPNYLCLG